jgi:hypothetical protein
MATYLTLPSDLPSHAEGFKPDDSVEHQVLAIAQHFLSQFEHAAQNHDGELFASLFAKNGFWRDIIAFTNDYRSIRTANIAKAANVSLCVLSPQRGYALSGQDTDHDSLLRLGTIPGRQGLRFHLCSQAAGT